MLKGAIGMILRDKKGGFIAMSNERIDHVLDTAAAEACALRDEVLLAQHLGIYNLVVE